MKRQILVVENDREICQSIQNRMQNENIEVFCVSSAIEALDSISKQEYCLVIISLHLAVDREMDMIRTIRTAKRMPIIALTDCLTTTDKVALFQAGTNAFVEKPVDFAVCIAQATSLIQLYLEAKEENRTYLPLIFGTELIIDPTYRQVIVEGEPLALTRKEFELLVCLARHPCQVWSRTQLYRQIWDDDLGISGDNTVKTHIGNLKKKLANLGKKCIQNSRGVGYKFVPPDCNQ